MCRYVLCVFLLVQLSGCFGYKNYDENIGELKKLTSLKELQGTYLAYNDRDESLKFKDRARESSLVWVLRSPLKYTTSWPENITTESVFIRVIYENEQKFHLQVLNAAGTILAQRECISPRDFVLKDGELLWSSKYSDIADRTTDTFFAINERNNFVVKQKNTYMFLALLTWSVSINYNEYQRVQ